jgi:TolA-binding protein
MLGLLFVSAVAVAAEEPPAPPNAAEGETEADRQYDFAGRLFSLRFYKTAAAEYARFLTQFPRDPRREQARYNLAIAYFKIGREEYDKALGQLATLRKEFPASSLLQDALFRSGHIHYLLGQSHRAIDDLSALARQKKVRDDLRVPMHHYLGRAYADRGNHAEAIRHLSVVAKASKHQLRRFALVVLADSELREGELKAAAATLESLIADYPALPNIGEMRLKLAETRLALKDHKEALDAFGKAGGSPEFDARAALGRARALHGLKRYKDAAQASRGLLKQLKETPATRKLQIAENALYVLGLAEIAQRRHGPAAEAFERLLRRTTKGDQAEDAAYKRCWCYFQLGAGHARQLVASCEAFLKWFPKSEWTQAVHFLAGEGQLQLGSEDAAIASYQKVSAGSAHYADALYRIAYCHHVRGRAAQAAAAYDSFLEKIDKHSKTPAALASAGGLYQSIRKYKEAAERYRKYLAVAPNGAHAGAVTYQIGLCHAKLGQFGEMATWLERYVKRFPQGEHAAAAYYWIGRHRRLVADELAQKKDLPASIDAYKRAAQAFRLGLARLPEKHGDRDTTRLALAECYYNIGRRQTERAEELEAAAHAAKAATKAEALEQAAAARDAADRALLQAAEGFLALMGRTPRVGQPIYFWTAAFFREHSRPADAIRVLEALLKRFPKAQRADLALYQLATLQTDLPKPDHADAIRYADRLLAEHKKSSLALQARFVKAESLFAIGKYDEAEPLYKQVSQKTFAGGLHLGSLIKLGHIAFGRKQYAEAVRYFAHVGVYDSAEHSAEGLYFAGRCHVELKSRDEGLRFWQRLLKRYGRTEWARKARAELDRMGFAVGSDGRIAKKQGG